MANAGPIRKPIWVSVRWSVDLMGPTSKANIERSKKEFT